MFFSKNQKTKNQELKTVSANGAGLIVDLRRNVPVAAAVSKPKEKALKKKDSLPEKNSFFKNDILKISLSNSKDLVEEIREDIKLEVKRELAPVVKKEIEPLIKKIRRLRFRKKQAWRFAKIKEEILSAKPIINSRRSWYDISRFLGAKKKRRKENSPSRSALSFLIFLILLIVPFKILASFGILNIKDFENAVMEKSLSGVNSLLAAADSVSHFDLRNADSELAKAGADFLSAQEDLNQINDTIFSLAALSSDPKLKLAANSKKFLEAGAVASSLGRNLIQASDKLFSGQADFGDSLESFLYYGRLAANDAEKLQELVSSIKPESLPEEYRDKFVYMQRQADLLSKNLGSFVDMGENLKDLLGLSYDKRYLLIFQNNSEMRGSGGFLGSYALVDIRDGKIKNLEVPAGGSYDLEAGLKGKKLIAPKPLWLVNPHWNFWDANWWPDWPKTARFLMDFYERSEGPSVDGVISLTPSVVEKMLEISGPIDMSAEYGVVITSENFWESVQKIVEYKNLEKTHPEALSGLNATSSPIVAAIPLEQDLENNAANKPKKIIGDLMARMLEIMPQKLSRENLPAIASIFEESVRGKHVLFYFKNEKAQAEILRRGLGGEIKDTAADYLQIVDANIAGQKTDRLISRKADLETEVLPDGSVINTLHITRTHQGIKNEALTGVRNVNWLRIYVPAGSELISASGFREPDASYFSEPDETAESLSELIDEDKAMVHEDSGVKIYSDSGKTVFANWTMTDPGESSEITFRYKLPFNLRELSENKNDSSWLARLNDWLNPQDDLIFPYSLLIQKQPGAWPIDFNISMAKPFGYEVFWRQDGSDRDLMDNFSRSNVVWRESWVFDKDKFASVLFKKEK